MSPDCFEHLSSLVGPVIIKQNTHLRESISAKQHLVITIRFLSNGDLPFFLVGDEIFPLKKWLMRPYPGTDLACEENKIYNYRHSMVRRVIENAFGILSTRWRIFHKPIRATIKNVENYTLSCLALHNYLRQLNNALYKPVGFVDSKSKDGTIKEGE